MTEPVETTASPEGTRPRSAIKNALMIAVYVLCVVLIVFVGQRLWRHVGELLETRKAAEDSVPVGYVGVHLRKSYYDRPAQFLSEQDGKKRLWAAKGEDGSPLYYDVGDATIRVESLSGGFGRDSNPGIDYPLFEGPDSERSKRLRSGQEMYGLVLGDGPRAYPADLLRKIEVVNDADGATPFAVVYDRSTGEVRFYDRTLQGRAVTFGTTGYALGEDADPSLGKPLLYDRRTKSLWLPKGDGLDCVSGQCKGMKLGVIRQPSKTTWSAWRDAHPETRILMGSDRSRPIPAE